MAKSQPPPTQENSSKIKNPPIAYARDGAVVGRLWKNQRPDGSFSLSATFACIYTDSDGEFREGRSFYGPNILRVEKVASRLHHAALKERRAMKAAAKSEAEQDTQDTPESALS